MTNRSPMLAILFVLSLGLATQCFAQLPDINEGYIPYQPYSVGDIDSVSMNTGNLLLNIPLLSYPQRGKGLKLTFSLHYSNAGWQRVKNDSGGGNPYYMAPEGPGGVGFALDGVNYQYSTNILLPGTGVGDVNENPPIHVPISTIYSSDFSGHLVEGQVALDKEEGFVKHFFDKSIPGGA